MELEKKMAVVLEAPNVAVPVGTTPDDQFSEVRKSPPDVPSQVAFCP